MTEIRQLSANFGHGVRQPQPVQSEPALVEDMTTVGGRPEHPGIVPLKG